VTDDETVESLKLMNEVPLIGLGESELERLVRGCATERWFNFSPPV